MLAIEETDSSAAAGPISKPFAANMTLKILAEEETAAVVGFAVVITFIGWPPAESVGSSVTIASLGEAKLFYRSADVDKGIRLFTSDWCWAEPET